MLIMFPVMNRNDIFSLIGIIVGIPGLLYFFLSGRVVIGVLTVLIVAAVLAAAWLVNQPQITIIDYDKRLTFDDQDAHSATQTSELTLRANHKGVPMFRLGSFSSDGSVTDILIDDAPPSRQEVRAGAIEVYKEFRNPLERGQKEHIRVSATYIDSFAKATEAYNHAVGHKTKKLRLTVNFHPDRVCGSVRAFLRYGGQIHKTLPEVEVSSDRRRARLEIKRPKPGAEYRIEWDW